MAYYTLSPKGIVVDVHQFDRSFRVTTLGQPRGKGKSVRIDDPAMMRLVDLKRGGVVDPNDESQPDFLRSEDFNNTIRDMHSLALASMILGPPNQ